VAGEVQVTPIPVQRLSANAVSNEEVDVTVQVYRHAGVAATEQFVELNLAQVVHGDAALDDISEAWQRANADRERGEPFDDLETSAPVDPGQGEEPCHSSHAQLYRKDPAATL